MSRFGRRRSGRVSRSPSTESPRSRPALFMPLPPRRRSTAFSATPGSRLSCERTRGELEAARTGSLPELVSLGDLRGDLHTHTTWSDGKDTLEAMVAEAIHLGYSYYAICDHSHRLRAGRREQQSAAIDRLATRVPIRLLKGVEVNIRVNGDLDMPMPTSPASTGWSPRPTARSKRIRRAGCSRRWRTHTSTASGT